jgi:uncharacterized spore protein YtfJ
MSGEHTELQAPPRRAKRKAVGAMDTKELLNRVAENLSVGRSFGAAYEKEELLIIPVALVAGGGGGGEGPIKQSATLPAAASGTAEGAGDAPADGRPPLGTGGGLGGLILPIGVYVVKGDNVRWVPAVDMTRVVLASLGLVRLLVHLFSNDRRRHRAIGLPADHGR